MDIRKLQRAIVDGLEDVKAHDIRIYNTEHLSSEFERVIVASGTSNRQTKALAVSVRDAVKSRGWQVLSMLVHFFKKCFMTPGTWRVFYHYVVLAVFGFAGITWLVQDALLPFLFVMLFAAPVMATLYTMICMKEVYIKMQRPIAVLK